MNPLLVDFVETIQTPRLLLRVPRAGDGQAVCESVHASIDELNLWLPWAKREYSPEDGEDWCRRSHGKFHLRELLPTLIFERETGLHVGNLGAFKFDFDIPACELGYWLRTDRTGCGYMTEAVAALSDYFFDAHHFRRIQIRCDAENPRSAAVAERAGFELEGTLRCDCRDHHAKLRDTRLYAKVRRSTRAESVPNKEHDR